MKRFLFSIFIMASLATAGCAAPSQTWYKRGGSQREFDIDARECEMIAKNQARQESALGRDFNPETFAEHYYRCLTASGWSRTPPGGDTTATAASPPQSSLGNLGGNTLFAFGASYPLPEDARLVSTTPQNIGSNRIESWLFSLPDGAFVNLVLQESDEAAFLEIDYPIEPPNRLYASDAMEGMRWSAFWSQNGREWVQGIGAFAFLGRHKRCIIVITAPLAAPDAPPPAGLSLAANQRQALEAFIARWQPWMEGLAPKTGFWGRLLKAVGRAMSPY